MYKLSGWDMESFGMLVGLANFAIILPMPELTSQTALASA